MEIPEKYGIGVDIMIEAKAKEGAIFDLYQRYSDKVLVHHKEKLKCENLKELFKFDKIKLMAVKCEKCELFN